MTAINKINGNDVNDLRITDAGSGIVISAAERTKLSGIEALADVTDATNVDAAGATMNSDTSLAGNGYFLDEDDMVSNSATKTVSQQSLVAYVATTVSSAKAYKGGYNAATNTPDLDTSPIANIKSGHVYDVTAAGTFFTKDVEIGDMLTAQQDNPTLESHWVITQANLTPASIKTQYESNADTNAFTDAEQSKLAGIEALADVTDEANVVAALDGATLTAATVATGDKILGQDVSDSDNLKTFTVQSIANINSTEDIQLAENKLLLLDAALSGNDMTSGEAFTGVLGESVVVGDGLYLKAADSKYWKWDADAAATAGPVLVMVAAEAGAADATIKLLKRGKCRASAFSGFAVGAQLFISTTPGLFVTTAPSGSGDIVRSVGHKTHNTNEIYFEASGDYLEVL